jgi:hypothetical protein
MAIRSTESKVAQYAVNCGRRIANGSRLTDTSPDGIYPVSTCFSQQSLIDFREKTAQERVK